MKNSLYICLALFVMGNYASGQKNEPDRLLFEWKNMVVNTAKEMPEEHFGFVPAEGLRSFEDLVKHITTSNRFFIGFLAGEDNNAKNKNTLESVKSKADII